MKKQLCIFIFLALIFSSCNTRSNLQIPTPSSLPEPRHTPTCTPIGVEVPRWSRYEAALSRAVLGTEDGLCEWEIYGVSGNEVYIWVFCESRSVDGPGGSVAAVIYLEDNGEIGRIAFPSNHSVFSPELVRTLYPPDIQPTIFAEGFDIKAAETSMNARRTSDGPPLIVTQGTPLP